MRLSALLLFAALAMWVLMYMKDEKAGEESLPRKVAQPLAIAVDERTMPERIPHVGGFGLPSVNQETLFGHAARSGTESANNFAESWDIRGEPDAVLRKQRELAESGVQGNPFFAMMNPKALDKLEHLNHRDRLIGRFHASGLDRE